MNGNRHCLRKNVSQFGDAKLVISVKEARKLLGKDFKDMPDKVIEDMIIKLNLISKGFIEQFVSI